MDRKSDLVLMNLWKSLKPEKVSRKHLCSNNAGAEDQIHPRDGQLFSPKLSRAPFFLAIY